MTAAIDTEAEGRYLEAVARRDAIRDAWTAEGSPLLTTGSTGQLVEHPFVKMLREHDVLVMRLEAVLRKRHAGPEPSAVITSSIGRNDGEYLLYPKADETRPMNPASVHDWFKRCLRLAGLPPTIKMHELRHSAADNLWRETGNLTIAQTLLRHESPATTAQYLQPDA